MNPRSSAKRRAETAAQGVTKRTRVTAYDDDESSDDEFLQAESSESSDDEFYQAFENQLEKEVRQAARVERAEQAQLLVANLNVSVENGSEFAKKSSTAAFRITEDLLQRGKNAIAALQRRFALPRIEPTTYPLEFLPVDVDEPLESLRMLSGDDLECSYCIETINDRSTRHGVNNIVMTNCNHPFHENCLKKWLVKVRTNPTCPICRTEVLWVATNIVSGTDYLKKSLEFTD